MIEAACRPEGKVNGPTAYSHCINHQLNALYANAGEPSLAGISSSERAMIESACKPARMVSGPAIYYNCERQQLAALQASGGKPSLAEVSSNDQAKIESACKPTRIVGGPAAYYGCLRQQLTLLSSQQQVASAGLPLRKISPDEMGVTMSHGPVSSDSARAASASSKRKASAGPSSGKTPAAPQPQPGTAQQDSAAAVSPPSFWAIAASVVGFAISLFVAGFLYTRFRRTQHNRCARCGRPVTRVGTHCPSCLADIQEQARRAPAERQAEERQRADEQRREREYAEEEAHRTYASRKETGQHDHESADDGQHEFDPYAVLGVSRDAGKEDIRAAYHREMANYHPDKVAHLGVELQELAQRKAQAINRAYEELMASTSV